MIARSRAIVVNGEELKTVSFPPATRHSAKKDEAYLRTPPLASTIGMNHASRASKNDAIPAAARFRDTFRRENKKRGVRKSKNEGRTPAPTPNTSPAGTTKLCRPQ